MFTHPRARLAFLGTEFYILKSSPETGVESRAASCLALLPISNSLIFKGYSFLLKTHLRVAERRMPFNHPSR